MNETTKVLTPQEQKDEEMISAAFQKLLDTYMASNHRKKAEIITKAFNFAKQAHRGVRRRSGEPYILHPIAVAQIACEEIGLGSTSICAALLHDVEEDTDYTNEDLSNLFGPRVANIVEGVTKISGGIFGDQASMQAETFKKLLLTMSNDIRVILIKISDRLHNMRTLSSMPPSKQYKIAGETMYIFAPLADRLGLNKIKTELEDLSFKYEHPEEYSVIERQLASTQADRTEIFESFVPPIREMLDKMGFKYHILKRVKTPYSIWHKIQTKNVAFNEIYDILAIRIVYTPIDRSKEIDECFSIYAGITKIYRPHPMRFRDWLSTPKANGYQALHNTFMSKDGRWIEVQIRSDRMDDIAEQGFAAHWKYKDKNAEYDETELDKWLDSIKEILDDPQPDTLDLLDTIKLNLFSKEILVFTPKGEIKKMPNDATALDYAFSIHSFLGTHCFGAKVNHKLVPLSYRLKSGDQVEILTSRQQQVKAEWLNFVTTAKAKGKIQAVLRREKRDKLRIGEEIMADFFKLKDIELNTTNIDTIVRFRGLNNRDELALALGEKKIILNDDDADVITGKYRSYGWRRYVPFMHKKKPQPQKRTAGNDFVKELNPKKTLVLTDDLLDKCTMASCCRPIPGDDALGYITPDHALEIHQRSCPVAAKLKARFGNRLIATTWDTHKMHFFPVLIHLRGVDSSSVLFNIVNILNNNKLQAMVKAINLDTMDGIFEGNIEFLVHDTNEVEQLCTSLLELETVEKAYRLKNK